MRGGGGGMIRLRQGYVGQGDDPASPEQGGGLNG